MKTAAFFRRAVLWGAAVTGTLGVMLPPGTVAAGSVTYTYNSLGRLTKAAYANGVVISYTYDAAGNRSNTTTSGVVALPARSALEAPQSEAGFTPWAVWARQHPLLLHQLPAAGVDPAVYGWNDRSALPESVVAAVFAGDGADRLLHLQGYAIDSPDAVGLWLNGTLLGYLSPTTDEGLNMPSLWLLPAALQLPGENTIALIPTTEELTWGVTRLGFYPLGSGLGNQEGMSGGDTSHAEGIELHLFSQGFGQTGDLLIELAGWDVNSADEIAIELNAAPLAELPPGEPKAWGAAARLRIGSPELLAGDNRLLISNRFGPLEPWAVRIEGIVVEEPRSR